MTDVCGTCDHWTFREYKAWCEGEKTGFGNCGFMPDSRWKPESSPCQFTPTRWLAVK